MTTTQYLATFLNHEKNLAKFSPRLGYIERVKAVLSQLGSPQKDLQVIHIAGSKGKGSTAAFTANILQAAGFRVGLYTSPHLYDVRERICIDFKSISEGQFSKLIKKIRPQLEAGRKEGLTYFEVLTIAAFCYFKEQRVDWVVLETGLGGRLDATNVCDSAISVITPISLEHTKQLGKTLNKIAVEKAAIIKSAKSVVIIAPQKSEVLQVIQRRCRDVGVKTILVKQGIRDVSPSLLGQHQRVNAAVAAKIADVLRISKMAIKRGIETVSWPLRFEIVSRKPLIVIDGAHNPESCERLSETLSEIFPKKKWILIFGSSDDKDIQGMVRPLLSNVYDVILTTARHPRAMAWNEKNTIKYFPKQDVVMTRSVAMACRFAKKIVGQNLIVVAGSLFVAAEAKKAFQRI